MILLLVFRNESGSYIENRFLWNLDMNVEGGVKILIKLYSIQYQEKQDVAEVWIT